MSKIAHSPKTVKLSPLQRELLVKVSKRHDADNWYLDKNGREWRCLHRMEERGLVAQQDVGEGLWRCYWDITLAGIAALSGAAPSAAAPVASAEPHMSLCNLADVFGPYPQAPAPTAPPDVAADRLTVEERKYIEAIRLGLQDADTDLAAFDADDVELMLAIIDRLTGKAAK